jgi:chemotaxis regulatin CheY-phosphate phosphatase CheZ
MNRKKLVEISDEEYLEIEEGILSRVRGRAFLRERDRRVRLVAMDGWKKLEARLVEQADRFTAAPSPAEEQHGPTHLRILRQELQEMSSYIQQTRSEIAALRPADAGSSRIMAATEELDAVVSATERATSDILNSAERIADLTGKALRSGEDPLAALGEIENISIDIMTACSFQDITGQRTTKVVNTLKYLEQRVLSMIEIWGPSMGVEPSADPDAAHRLQGDTRPDAHLLNGPQLRGGVSQNDIDALFGGDTDTLPGDTSSIAEDDQSTASAGAVTTSAKAAPEPVGEKRSQIERAGDAGSPGAQTTSSQADIDALFG